MQCLQRRPVLSRPLVLVLATGAAAAAFFPPAPSPACSLGPQCSKSAAAPSSGATAPVNIGAFPIVPATASIGGVSQAAVIELLDSTGQVVPTSVVKMPPDDSPGLVPQAALAPGSYHFRRHDPPCPLDGEVDAGETVVDDEQPFTLSEPAPLPTDAGTIEVLAPAISSSFVPNGTSACSTWVTFSAARLLWHPSPALEPYLAVVKVVVTVEGTQWNASGWGGQLHQAMSMVYSRQRDTDEIYTTCFKKDSTLDQPDPGVTAGTHTGSFEVWLPNQSRPLPAIPFTFTTSCADALAPDAGVSGPATGEPVDGGSAAAEAGTSGPTSPNADASLSSTPGAAGSDTGAPADSRPRSGGGCSYGAGSADWLGILVALGILGWRRRRV